LGIGLDTKYTLATRKYIRILFSKQGLLMEIVAFVAFLPVVVWNIQHGFASLYAGAPFAIGFKEPGEGGLVGYIIGSLLYYPVIWVVMFTLPVALLLMVGPLYGLRKRGLPRTF